MLAKGKIWVQLLLVGDDGDGDVAAGALCRYDIKGQLHTQPMWRATVLLCASAKHVNLRGLTVFNN